MSSLPPPSPPPGQPGWGGQPAWGGQQWPPGAPAAPYAAAVASPPRGDASTTLVLGVLSIVGAFLLLIGSFLPWATVQAFFAELSVNGFDAGDGKLTAVAGFVSLILFVLGTTLRRWPLFLAGAIVCGLGGLVAGYDVINLSNEFGDADLGGLAQASIGIGLWLCLLGALLGTATAIAALVRTASKP